MSTDAASSAWQKASRQFSRLCAALCGISEAPADALRFFLLLLAIVCLVYARPLYFPIFGIDTYTYFNGNGNPDTVFEIIQGRWGAVALNHVLGFPLLSPLLSQLFFLLCLCFGVLITALFWSLNTGFRSFCACLLMCLFPYWAAMAYFATHHVVFAISLILSSLAPILAWQGSWRRLACAILCVALAASFYQSGIMLSLAIICSSLMLAIFRQALSQPGAPALSGAIRAFLALLGGGLLYLGLHKLILAWSGLGSLTQGYAIGMNFSLERPLDAFRLIFPGNPFLLPALCQLVPLMALAAILAALAGKKRYPAIPLFICALCAAICAVMALAFVQPVPLASRAMCGLAILWGALAVMALSLAPLAKTMLCAMLIAAVVFGARINYAWQIQSLTTAADLADARGMWTGLNNLGEFATAPKPLDVAFAGCLAKDSRGWSQDWESIFGMSQFACLGGNRVWPPHPQAVLRLVGANVKWRQARASDLAQASGRKPWPAAESVFWNGDHAVVWLGPPQRMVQDMEPRLALLRGCLQGGGLCPGPLLAIKDLESGPRRLDKLRPCMGYVDSEDKTGAPGGFRLVRGWAWNAPAKNIPPYVALLNCQGQVAGIAATGAKRPDLVESLALDAEFAGFAGYLLEGEKVCAFACWE